MQRAMVPTMIAVVASQHWSKDCFGSNAHPSAETAMEVTAFVTCDKVLEEVVARMQGNSDGSWLDPHNGGHYVLFVSDSESVNGHRDTGSASIAQGGPFRDNLRFNFIPLGADCIIQACSSSQVQSVTDFSGGYCNLRNLYCGSDVGCTTLKHDFQFSETHIGLSDGKYIDGVFHEGASADASMCIVPVAAEV